MDDADRAFDLECISRNQAILGVKARFEALPYTGYCHYCKEATGATKIFCDPECRDDYDRQEKLKHINGRKAW